MAKQRKKQTKVEEPVVDQQATEVKDPIVEDQQVEVEQPQQEPVVEQKEEEVKEEPKVEPKEASKTEPKKEEPKQVKKTFDDVIADAMKDPLVVPTAKGLQHYVEVCYTKTSGNGETIANANYNLYNIIINALNNPDRKASTKQMNLINKVFLVEKDRYFSPIALSRYDHFWKFGASTKMGYTMLVKFISAMANPNTRKEVAKTHIASKMGSFLPQGIVGKLETYYKI